ncbi:hypothetical protein [Kitasatospora sp. NPDC005751]|uniref:hypothetical protein n=1 Tax=Kitasatospora sp. NPDC005751 TaxID=3157064 RepID=UPI00340DC237
MDLAPAEVVEVQAPGGGAIAGVVMRGSTAAARARSASVGSRVAERDTRSCFQAVGSGSTKAQCLSDESVEYSIRFPRPHHAHDVQVSPNDSAPANGRHQIIQKLTYRP